MAVQWGVGRMRSAEPWQAVKDSGGGRCWSAHMARKQKGRCGVPREGAVVKGLEGMVLTYESRLWWGDKKCLRQKSKQGEQVGIRIKRESAVCVCHA